MSEVKALVLNLTKIVTANSGKPKALINKITDDAVKLKSGDRLDDVKFISIDEKDYTVVKNSSEVNIGSNNNQMASNSVNSNNNLIPFTEEVLKLTNDFRVKNGRSRLTMNSDLSEAAQDHSEDMAKLDFFSHTGKDGSKAGDRITDAGYEWNTYGENIAAGQRTPDQVVQGWINSPGHRANMLNPNFKELGVGYFFLKNDTGNVNYNNYWTQVFGRSRNPITPKPPTPTPKPPTPTPNPTKAIRYEAEKLNLDGYAVETVDGSGASGGKHISLKSGGQSTGKVSGVFNGEAGTYQVKVGYYDENDGVSSATVNVAGKSTNFKFDKNLPSNFAKSQALTSKITHDAVQLKSGDRFEISGSKNAGEFARFDYVEFKRIEDKTNTAVKDSGEMSTGSDNTPMNDNPTPAAKAEKFAEDVLKLTNDFRVKNGRSRLTMNSDLSEAAQDHSEDMAKLDFFSHTGKDGSKAGDRITDAGYEWNTYGENIAAGQQTPEQVVQGWIDSPGHRANMLNPNFKELGVGHFYLENDTGNVNYNNYWTQVFGRSKNQVSPTNNNSNPSSNPVSNPNEPQTPRSQKDDPLIGDTLDNKLSGTSKNDRMFGGAGDDTIKGRKGNDRLQGDEGSDTLIGGSGNDFLIGVKPGTSGKGEKDVLHGGKDADTFVLGDKMGVYYDNGNSQDYGFKDYALVKDFNFQQGDKIILNGKPEDYRLGSISGSKSGTGILHKDSGKDELIAILQNTSGLKLESKAFQFV